MFFIIGVQTFTELCVSLKRIDAFLTMEEPPSAKVPSLTPGGSSVVPADSSDAAAPHDLESVALLAIPTAPVALPSTMTQPPIMSQSKHPDGFVALQGADYDWRRPLGHSLFSEDKSLRKCDPQGSERKGGQVSSDPMNSKSAASSTPGTESVSDNRGAAGGGRGSLELQPASGPTLKGLVLELRPGELLGITGEVGSGKSSLLSALLGELLPLKEPQAGAQGDGVASASSGSSSGQHKIGNGFGGPIVVGSMAYCPQVPWIVSGSVRDNIVFGSPWDAKFYVEVLEACALDQVSDV